MFLRRDLDTLTIGEADGVPGAQVICDLMTPEGERFAGDPRGVLARALAEAASLGFDYAVAMELEFFLLNTDTATGGVRPGGHDRASYFAHPVDGGALARAAPSTTASAWAATCDRKSWGRWTAWGSPLRPATTRSPRDSTN